MTQISIKYQFFLAVCSLFLFCQCRNESATDKLRTLDPEPILKLACYDRDLADRFNLYRPNDIKGLINQGDTIRLEQLALTSYIFAWSNGPGGTMNRILCFCRDTGTFFQREFVFGGEYKMSLDNEHGPTESGNNVSLGIQLSQLALEMGPKLYSNLQKMRNLLITTMEKTLKCPRIDESMLKELDTNHSAHFFKYDDGLIKDTRPCIESFKEIRNEMAQKDPNVFFFQGELYNGIWRGRIQQLGNRNQYFIKLDYLNGACAYILRF